MSKTHNETCDAQADGSASPAWVADAVFYQIFPDRFARSDNAAKPSNLEGWDDPPTNAGFKGGDLRGITERLDYLVDLGITAIYLNPIFQSAANHRYHTHDYYRIDPLLGGDAAFRDLVAAARARSMRIILDGVFNHASRGFFQFNHILENGPESPYMDWFRVKGFPLRAYDRRRKPNYDAWWNLHALPKLNTENPTVRSFIMEVAEHWLREGIDGWRLDVPREIKTPGFWEEFRRRTRAVNPEAYLVGEIWGDGGEWVGGTIFDAVMNYVLYRACLGFFGGDALDTRFRPGGYRLRRLDGRAFGAEIDRLVNGTRWEVTLSQFNLLGSHDTPRILTMLNGERRRVKLAVLFLAAFPGAPCLYYGDEIGLEGWKDPACRGAFPWDEDRWDTDLRDWIRRCLRLRHDHAVLRRGGFATLLAEEYLYAFARGQGTESVVAVFNAGASMATVRVPVGVAARDGARLRDLVSGEYRTVQGETLVVPLAGLSGALLSPVSG